MGNHGDVKLLDQVRNKACLLHLAKSTETAYVKWIVDFLHFHRNRAGQWIHPVEMDSGQVNQYLEYLAVQRKVAASTQNQALSALLFLFTKVFDKPIQFDAPRAKTPERIPVVLPQNEVFQIISLIPAGTTRLMAGLMYGSGLRLMASPTLSPAL